MRHEAIYATHQGVVSISGDMAFDAQGNPVTVDEQAVQAEITRLQADYIAKEYQRQRAQAYPSMADQLDLIYHEGIDAWKETIAAVKQEYPKP